MSKNTISRTTAINLINSSKGRRFTVTFKKSTNGELRTINGSRKSQTPLGNIVMYSVKDKATRSFNPYTLTELRINGNIYRVR